MRAKAGLYLSLLLGAALLLRLFFLSNPRGPVFDELNYLPYAINYLEGKAPVLPHPPLGVLLLAGGIKIWGDNPLGWRLFPVLFSLLGIALTFFLAWLLTSNFRVSFYAAFFLAVSPFWFGFSRLGMLDIFLTVFILGMSLFYLKRNYWLFGLFLGLSLSVKWTAVFPAVLPVLFEVFFILRGKRAFNGLAALGFSFLGAALIYFLSSAFFYQDLNPAHFLLREKRMLNYHLNEVPTDLSYASPAWSWYLIPQAIVAYQSKAGNILLTENPALLWLGLLGIAWLLGELLKNKGSPLVFPLLAFLVLSLPWFFAGRAVYFYYILPALPFLFIMAAYFLARLFSEGKEEFWAKLYLVFLGLSFFYLYPQMVIR